jgi:hypothetical protein
VEYTEKSKNLSDHLRELKTEIEVLKKEDTENMLDRLHEEGVLRGETKYSTLRQVRHSHVHTNTDTNSMIVCSLTGQLLFYINDFILLCMP